MLIATNSLKRIMFIYKKRTKMAQVRNIPSFNQQIQLPGTPIQIMMRLWSKLFLLGLIGSWPSIKKTFIILHCSLEKFQLQDIHFRPFRLQSCQYSALQKVAKMKYSVLHQLLQNKLMKHLLLIYKTHWTSLLY